MPQGNSAELLTSPRQGVGQLHPLAVILKSGGSWWRRWDKVDVGYLGGWRLGRMKCCGPYIPANQDESSRNPGQTRRSPDASTSSKTSRRNSVTGKRS
jgi:hypothetical protein